MHLGLITDVYLAYYIYCGIWQKDYSSIISYVSILVGISYVYINVLDSYLVYTKLGVRIERFIVNYNLTVTVI